MIQSSLNAQLATRMAKESTYKSEKLFKKIHKAAKRGEYSITLKGDYTDFISLYQSSGFQVGSYRENGKVKTTTFSWPDM